MSYDSVLGRGQLHGHGEDRSSPSDDRAHPADRIEIVDDPKLTKELCRQMTIQVRVPSRGYGFTKSITLEGCYII